MIDEIETFFLPKLSAKRALQSLLHERFLRTLCFVIDWPNTRTYIYVAGTQRVKMGEFQESRQVYDVFLDQATNESDKAPTYGELGLTKDSQGEYKKAITFYEKALEIDKKTLSPKHPNLAASYNNIGLVYDSMGEYSKALSSHEKALKIRQQSLPASHPDLAASYKNISIVYKKMGEYSKAISFYEKALKIQQQSLPPNHLGLGASYNNIGMLYENIGDYSKARSFYECAVDNGQQSFPPNHPILKHRQKNLEDIKKKL